MHLLMMKFRSCRIRNSNLQIQDEPNADLIPIEKNVDDVKENRDKNIVVLENAVRAVKANMPPAYDANKDIRDLLAAGKDKNKTKTKYDPRSKGNAERTNTLKDQDAKIREYIKDIKDGILDVENREETLTSKRLSMGRN